jgi:hypothetical protein
MKIFRLSRAIAMFAALFSMLFMQFAVASYACPVKTSGSSNYATMRVAMEQLDMSHCEGMDTNQTSLCYSLAHGEAAKQSADNPQLPDTPPFIPVELVQALYLAEQFPLFSSRVTATPILGRDSAPPIAIRHCCFRI